MELINNRQEKSVQQPMRALSPDLRQKMMLVVSRYGDRNSFLTTFNPKMQLTAAENTERAYFGTAPTLGLVKQAYGDNMPVMWLMPQVYDLCEFAGAKKMDEWQAEELARILAHEYGYLKVTEFLLFFYKLKRGDYGHFFGSVDPMRITTAIREFLTERAFIVSQHESERAAQKAEEDRKNAVTLREFCRLRGLPETDNIIEIMRIKAK